MLKRFLLFTLLYSSFAVSYVGERHDLERANVQRDNLQREYIQRDVLRQQAKSQAGETQTNYQPSAPMPTNQIMFHLPN